MNNYIKQHLETMNLEKISLESIFLDDILLKRHSESLESICCNKLNLLMNHSSIKNKIFTDNLPKITYLLYSKNYNKLLNEVIYHFGIDYDAFKSIYKDNHSYTSDDKINIFMDSFKKSTFNSFNHFQKMTLNNDLILNCNSDSLVTSSIKKNKI